MKRKRSETRLDLFLDLMSSRWASGLAMILVVLVSFASYGFVRKGEVSAQQAQALFDGPTVRQTAHAVSDIYRLRIALENAVAQGGFSPETRADFLLALDYLYVRADNYARSLGRVPTRADSAKALQAINDIVVLSDTAAASGFPDVDQLAEQVDGAGGAAQSALMQYMNALHVEQQDALNGTVVSLAGLTRLHSMFLALMLVFAVGILTLLRREVLNRHKRSEAEARVSFLAYHDELTGLGNRARFSQEAGAFFTTPDDGKGYSGALAYIDIDEFKEINDVFGHPVGDAVLCQVADRIRMVSEKHDALAVRIAGDEFAVLLKSGLPKDMRAFGTELLAAVAEPVSVHGNVIVPELSIGIASAGEVAKTSDVSLDSMSRSADYALYAAKRIVGRSNLQLFDEALSRQLTLRRARLKALEEALINEELDVWLQPQINLETLELAGFEALARWTHDGEMVRPDEFIALAEESGLIVTLDSYMLRCATRAMAEWNDRHGVQIPVSVNISAVHLGSRRLLGTISEALRGAGLPPQLLTVELTETVEVSDWGPVVEKLVSIRDLGCRLSIDDFGSGYSSLGYLRKMPAHELKIDRSLVIGIESSSEGRSIVSSVVDIAHSLNFTTVIEGIETVEQALIARKLGCTTAQGYLFCRPMPYRELPGPGEFVPAHVRAGLTDDTAMSNKPSDRKEAPTVSDAGLVFHRSLI